MRRIGRLLAGVAIGLSLLFTPVAPAASAEPAPAAVVVAQQPAPGQQPGGETPAERERRTILGVAGLVLIGAVLVSRRLRKKPVLFVEWKKK
ncbi:hypothetical protein GCM10009854_14110 [Saccharopolyspora halophila]|uniref:LPXTG cell wall anchor domain-containing protein n=1 Tax=Saccharopolyspora halophila TaxID=405551 RepID=A0ABP5SX14_9PSEU